MSCGSKTASPGPLDVKPFTPDGADGSSGVSVGYMQIVPDDFDREELQDIRDRARRLSIQGSPAKTLEERLYQQLADIADTLDAITARFEDDVAEMEGNVTITTVPIPTPNGCGKPGCCGNPVVILPFVGDLNT